MPEEDLSSKLKIIFKDNFLESTSVIALITLFFYFISYALKIGYYDYFNIPRHFVRFDLNNLSLFSPLIMTMLFLLLGLAIIIVISIPLSNSALTLDKNIQEHLKGKRYAFTYELIIVILCLGFSIGLIIHGLTSEQIRSSHIIVFVSSAVILGLYWLTMRLDKKFYLLKLSTIILGCIFIVYVFSLYAAAYVASAEDRFPTTTIDNTTYVIIDIYEKNQYIIKELINGEVGDTFKVIEMKEVDDIHYNKVSIEKQ